MSSWFGQSYYRPDDTAEQVCTRLGALIDDLSLDKFSYALIKPPNGSNIDPASTLHTNYPPEWVGRYVRHRYLQFDPVCDLTAKSTRPFYWGQGRFLRSFRKQQRLVFDEAREFRIVNGLSIPIRGAHGEIATFNVVSTNAKRLTDAIRCEHERLFQAAFDTHEIVLKGELASAEKMDRPVELSVREKECLLWTLEGKTAEDVAMILGLSVFTVNHHASTAARKLGSLNKHHAAVQALRAGLI